MVKERIKIAYIEMRHYFKQVCFWGSEIIANNDGFEIEKEELIYYSQGWVPEINYRNILGGWTVSEGEVIVDGIVIVKLQR